MRVRLCMLHGVVAPWPNLWATRIRAVYKLSYSIFLRYVLDTFR